MSSHNPTNFQPTRPRRTNTHESQDSQYSSRMSIFSSEASTISQASTTEASFFGAITARIRGRSRSRSRGPSRHPYAMEMPPTNLQSRQQSVTSSTRPAPIPVQKPRSSQQGQSRRSTHGSDPWRGRHSNDWLFNGYSVTATAKDLIKRSKS